MTYKKPPPNFRFTMLITITFTKAFAFIILATGSVFAFINKNPEVMMFALSLAAGLAGLKNWNDARIQRRHIDEPYNQPYQPPTLPGSPNDPNPKETDPEL